MTAVWRIAHCLCALHLIGSACYSNPAADGRAFSGVATYKVMVPEAKGSIERTFRITANLSTGQWEITTAALQEQDLGTTTFLYNGQELYKTVRSQTDPELRRVRIAEAIKGMEATTGVISPDARRRMEEAPLISTKLTKYPAGIPSFGGDLAFPLWLGLLSQPYLDSLSDSAMPDFTSMGGGPILGNEPALRLIIQRRHAGAIWFPEEILFESLGFWQSRSANGATEAFTYPPPYDQGFLRSRYRVYEWGEAEGLPFPRRATLEVYNPLRDGRNTLKTETVVRATFVTHSVSGPAEQTMSHLPAVNAGERVYVTDYTFETSFGTPIVYVSTNGVIRDQEEMNRIRANNEAREMRFRELQSQARPVRRPLVMTVIIGGALIPVVLALLFQYHRRNMIK